MQVISTITTQIHTTIQDITNIDVIIHLESFKL